MAIDKTKIPVNLQNIEDFKGDCDSAYVTGKKQQGMSDNEKVQALNNIQGKEYDTESFSGLGKKVLAKNIVQLRSGNAKNVLDQSMMPVETGKQTIYVIQYDYDLNGATIRIPDNSVLKFDGGSLSNGTIVGNFTSIQAPMVKIFGTDIHLTRDMTGGGTMYNRPNAWNNSCLYAEWFGAKGDDSTDDTSAIQAAVDNARLSMTGICAVKLLRNHVYKTTSHIKIPSFMRFGGLSVSEGSMSNYFRPCIHQSEDDSAIMLYGHDYAENGNVSRVMICDLYLTGSTTEDNSGIRVSSTVGGGIGETTIQSVFVENFKLGVSITGTYSLNIHLNDICTKDNNVGIGIYIKFTEGCYGLDIRDCYIAFTTIGGIYFESPTISGPLNLLNTYIESCGNEYSLNTLNTYGSWGLYLMVTSQFGTVNIDNCYFESNCPCRAYGDGTLNNDNPYGFIEVANPVASKERYIYIKNPNYKKTAEIVMEGKMLNVNVTHTHFSVNYQTISIVNSGNLTFTDNTLYIPGRDLDESIQDSIVKIYDEVSLRSCEWISVAVKRNNVSSGNLSNYGNKYDRQIKSVLEFVDSIVSGNSNTINPIKITLDIDYPLLDENYRYSRFPFINYGEDATVYIDPNSPYTYRYGFMECPFNSLEDAVTKLNHSPKTKEVTIILLNDMTVTAFANPTVNCFKSGVKYNIICNDGDAKKTLTFNVGYIEFNGCDVCFKNLNIVTGNMFNVKAKNCSVSYDNCNIDFGSGNNHGLLFSAGIVQLSLSKCVLTRNNESDTTVGNTKDTGLVFTALKNCTNATNIPFVDDSNMDFSSLTPTT